jgi:hypothetical protein
MAATALAPKTVSLTIEEQQELADSSRVLMRLMNRMTLGAVLDQETALSIAQFIACSQIIYEFSRGKK